MKLLSLHLGVVTGCILAWTLGAQGIPKTFENISPALLKGNGRSKIHHEEENRHNRAVREAANYLEIDPPPIHSPTDEDSFLHDRPRESSIQKRHIRNFPRVVPLDKISGGTVLREMVEAPPVTAGRLDAIVGKGYGDVEREIPGMDPHSGSGLGISRRLDLLDQQKPLNYYRKLVESRGFRPRPKAIFDEIDRMGIQGFGKRLDEIDRVGFRNFGKKNFDEIDKSGFRDFGKRNFDEIDKTGFKDFQGKRYFDEIDRSGFGDFGKRNFDEIDKSGFRDFGKRNFDEIDKSGFKNFQGKRYFDEIDRTGFKDFGKRNFDEIDKSGFRDFGKRNFDEIDKSGFRDFGKRNFDEIDKSGFRDFGKRSVPEGLSNKLPEENRENQDNTEKSEFLRTENTNLNEAEKPIPYLLRRNVLQELAIPDMQAVQKRNEKLESPGDKR